MPSQLAMIRRTLLDLPPLSASVRRAGEGDEGEVARVLGLAFPEMAWDANRVRRDLTGSADVDSVWVVEDGGRVAATSSVQLRGEPGRGTIHWVGADPAFAGRGHGGTAVLACLHRMAEIGLADADLTTDDARLPAIRTYRRLGFEPLLLEPDHEERWARVAV